MEWKDREESDNVDDRRHSGGKSMGVAAGGAGILVIILGLIFGINPQQLQKFLGGAGGAGPNQPQGPVDPKEEEMAKFTKVIFRDTEVIWEKQFAQLGKRYPKPTLILYTDRDTSKCGAAEAAMGPFYCPADTGVYIDLSFYKTMEEQLKSPGEFARAYVIAHEVGHHVQRLLGYSARVDEARQTMSKVEYNKMSVRLELQADYLAGVWAHHAKKLYDRPDYKFLDERDIASATNAAFHIGDDYLQKQARGRAVAESFTHGTSAQRQRWFMKGFQTGDVKKASELFDLPYSEL
jgi:predicted metalloprotease